MWPVLATAMMQAKEFSGAQDGAVAIRLPCEIRPLLPEPSRGNAAAKVLLAGTCALTILWASPGFASNVSDLQAAVKKLVSDINKG